MKDYYKILQVDSEATPRKIRKSLFSIAKTCHPKIVPSQANKEKFIEILEAYEVLNSETGRKLYNELRKLNSEQLSNPNLNKPLALVENLAKKGIAKGALYSKRTYVAFKEEYNMVNWWDIFSAIPT